MTEHIFFELLNICLSLKYQSSKINANRDKSIKKNSLPKEVTNPPLGKHVGLRKGGAKTK